MVSTNMKQILINFVTMGILVFAIMSVILIVQSDSNIDPEKRITNNSLINESYGSLAVSLDKEKEAQESADALNEAPPSGEQIGDLSVASIISTTWNSRRIVTGLWNIYIKLPMVILGVSPIVASAISTILIILMAIGIWAVWKGAVS